MQGERIYFQCGELRLEGILNRAEGHKGAIITHPHPLYGGDMNNNVVDSIAWAYQQNKFTTLRFNFRGVGASHGSYDEGIGEQEDVAAAIDLLKREGCTEIHLAGYSFGAWIIAQGLRRCEDCRDIVMVSPPAAFLDFHPNGPDPRIGLVITGSHDDIAPPSMVRELAKEWNPEARLEIVQGADHFYWGKEHMVSQAIEEYLSRK